MSNRRVARVPHRGSYQSGRTIVELMIAIALSLLIVGAVGSLYVFTSQSARTSQQASSAEERGRVGIFLVAEPIAMAGFGNVNNGALSTRYGAMSLQGPHLRGCTNGRFNDPANLDFTCVPSAQPGDALFVAFQAESAIGIAPQGNQPFRDCGGGIAPLIGDALTVRNVYSIELTGGGALELQCLGNSGGQRQGLIRDVEDFKVYFAFDTAGYNRAGVNPANFTVQPSALQTAAQLNALPVVQNEDPNTSAGNAWNHVVAVLVCIQLRASEAGTTPDGVSRYRPCPQDEIQAATGTAEVAVNDGIARRTITQMITLRARAQAAPASVFLP